MTIENLKFDRSVYDKANLNAKSKYIAKPGITKELILKISSDKNEPEWMLNKRLKALSLFQETPTPNWGPDISMLNLDEIIYYVDPDTLESKDWNTVPDDIKETFEKLGIPQAEREALSGVGAQYDSGMVYHNLKKEWEEKGVIFENMDVAVQKYPDIVKKYFMTNCVPIHDHKFSMLHAAVWSGGTFIYIPPKVKVDIPLQAYFRMNAQKGGQFEHTLIIADKGAELHYIEGCFTKGNKVQTIEGLKNIKKIKTNDLVLTHTGKYQKVNEVMKNTYSGELYDIEIYGDSTLKIQTTFDHPLLCVKRDRDREKNKVWNKEWIIPKYISKKDYLCIPRNKVLISKKTRLFPIKKYLGKKQGYTTVNKKVKINSDFFKLIGYYLAEGSISKGSYLNFSFGTVEKELIGDVKKLMKKVFGIEKNYEAIHKINNGTSVVFSSVELCRIFEQFGKSSHEKKLPEWVLFEDYDKQKELLKGYFLGDGNFYKKKHSSGFKEVIRTNTTSQILSKQIRDLYLRLGIPAFLNKRDRSKENRKTMYTIGISGFYLKEVGKILGLKLENKINNKTRASMFNVDDEFIYMPVKSIKHKEVKKIKTYNLSVDKTQTYTIEGITVHNCSAPQYAFNSLHAGCVELYVMEDAIIRYSSIENWSKNTFNLNTKRAIVQKNARVEWLNGNMGSGKTMLYPCSILIGENSRSENLGIAFAGKDQEQDTGSKVVHIGKNTTSIIKAKSISKDGGISTYRGLVKINKMAKNAISHIECDALMVDEKSVSNTYPAMQIERLDAQVIHEAKVGKIGEEEIFYLTSKGLNPDQAKQLIVNGFINEVIKKLPFEYAVELNKLIELEMENSIG